MKQIALLSIFIIYYSLFNIQISHAQCCSPGSPIGGTSALGVLDKGNTKIFLNYKNGYAGTYYEGYRPATSQFIKNGNYNYRGFSIDYGIAEKLTSEIETGYFVNKTQNYVVGIIPEKIVGKGLTDITFGVKYNFHKNLISDWEITSGAGIKIPLGPYNQTYQGAILTRDLQPTTGSFDFIHTLFLYKGYIEKHLRFFLINRIEFKGQNPDQYKYGNLSATSFFISYSISPRWNIIAEIRSEIRERDSRPATGIGLPTENGREKIIPTGSQKIFVIPQLSYSFNKSWIVSTLLDLPVYQFYNDKQLASTLAVTLSISKVIKSKQ